jgi:lysozyme
MSWWHHFEQAIISVGGILLLFVVHRPKPAVEVVPPPAVEPTATTAPAAPVAPVVQAKINDGLTARGCMELVAHEAIVCEAYKDSREIWTWGIGVTDASGRNVERYIDNPQPIAICLQVFIWLLRTRYLPEVRQAFAGRELTEAQLAAALSFHYNTGAILHASWVSLWVSNHATMARTNFMDWDKPAGVIERRQRECDLFFDGKWSSDGMATVIPVHKPSYQPDFAHAKRVNVLPTLQLLLGAG